MISNSGTSTLGLYDFKRQMDSFGGVDYFRPALAGGYLPNARVMLGNGDIVKNNTNGNLTTHVTESSIPARSLKRLLPGDEAEITLKGTQLPPVTYDNLNVNLTFGKKSATEPYLNILSGTVKVTKVSTGAVYNINLPTPVSALSFYAIQLRTALLRECVLTLCLTIFLAWRGRHEKSP